MKYYYKPSKTFFLLNNKLFMHFYQTSLLAEKFNNISVEMGNELIKRGRILKSDLNDLLLS